MCFVCRHVFVNANAIFLLLVGRIQWGLANTQQPVQLCQIFHSSRYDCQKRAVRIERKK